MGECKGCSEDIPESFIICRYNGFILNHAIQDKSKKIFPYTLGHLVLMPKKRKMPVDGSYHPVDSSDLTPEEFSIISQLFPEILSAMRKVLPAIKGEPIQRIYIGTFYVEPDWHLHIHLVPRYKWEGVCGPKLLTMERQLSDYSILEVVTEMKRQLCPD